MGLLIKIYILQQAGMDREINNSDDEQDQHFSQANPYANSVILFTKLVGSLKTDFDQFKLDELARMVNDSIYKDIEIEFDNGSIAKEFLLKPIFSAEKIIDKPKKKKESARKRSNLKLRAVVSQECFSNADSNQDDYFRHTKTYQNIIYSPGIHNLIDEPRSKTSPNPKKGSSIKTENKNSKQDVDFEAKSDSEPKTIKSKDSKCERRNSKYEENKHFKSEVAYPSQPVQNIPFQMPKICIEVNINTTNGTSEQIQVNTEVPTTSNLIDYKEKIIIPKEKIRVVEKQKSDLILGSESQQESEVKTRVEPKPEAIPVKKMRRSSSMSNISRGSQSTKRISTKSYQKHSNNLNNTFCERHKFNYESIAQSYNASMNYRTSPLRRSPSCNHHSQSRISPVGRNYDQYEPVYTPYKKYSRHSSCPKNSPSRQSSPYQRNEERLQQLYDEIGYMDLSRGKYEGSYSNLYDSRFSNSYYK